MKDRIASGLCNGMENNIYRNIYEVPFLNIRNNLQSRIPWYDNMIKFKLYGNTDDFSDEMNVTVRYNPDAKFEYFTMERCKCDGTYHKGLLQADKKKRNMRRTIMKNWIKNLKEKILITIFKCYLYIDNKFFDYQVNKHMQSLSEPIRRDE